MKHVYFFTNRVVKSFRALALLATLAFGVTTLQAAVVSGTTYPTVPNDGMPTGWTADVTGTTYAQLLASTKYIQTDAFCQAGFSTIVVTARTYGGVSGSSNVITISWYDSATQTETVLGTVTPTTTGLVAKTLTVSTNPTANQEGYIKVQAKSATGTKGVGISAVKIEYTTGSCSACTAATTVWDASTVNKTFGDAAFTNAFLSDNTGAETYASSNTGVATVNATSGLVTIVGVGTTTISVTQPETGGICAVSTNYTLNVACATLATPTGFTTGTVAATTADFSWNAVANASSYTLTYTDGGSTLYKTGIAGTSSQLTGLTPSTQYLVTVKAVGNGSTYCNSAESTTADITTTALPTYTVTFNAGTGSCGTASLTEASGGAGVTLPTASPSAGCAAETPAWEFAGWATASQTETTSAPTLYTSGSTYNPSANVTLYAVYKQTTDGGTTPATTSITFSTVDGGWTNSLSQADGGDYWKLFESGDYFLSPSIDLSTITSVSATIGTYGGGTHILSVQDESSNVWGTASSASSTESATSVTKSGSLSGTGKVKFVCTTGSSSAGLRVQAITINYEEGSSTTTYNSNPNCVVCDANTLALTSTTQTINIDGTGYADYNVSTLITSKNGNGAVTYSVTPADAIIDEDTGEFTTDTPGTYYVSVIQAVGTELPTPICAKTVKDTIVVLATPVVTIVDVTPLTFTANCGEASVAQSVSVSGYNLSANMTASAPTNFLVSSDNTSYGASATFTQSGGSASGTLYIKANPPAGSTDPISGNVSLTSTDATTRTLAVSATVSCTPVHVYFNDKGNVIADSTEYVGGVLNTLPTPTGCTGFVFDGWYTTTLNDAASYTKLTAPYTVTGETTLYAVYAETTTGTDASFVLNKDDTAMGTSYADTDFTTDGFLFGRSQAAIMSNSIQVKANTSNRVWIKESLGKIKTITTVAQTNEVNVYASTSANGSSTPLTPTSGTTSTTAVYDLTGDNYDYFAFGATGSYCQVTSVTVEYTSSTTTYTTTPLCCTYNLTTPTNFAATPGDTQVSLSWDAVANADTYNIICSTDPTKNVTGATGTSTTITGLTNCTTYSFVIKAIGDGVDYCPSPESGAITATPQSAVLTATFNAGANGTCGTASLTNTCLSNDITLPSVTPNVGFAFDGWQVDGAGTVYAAGSTFTLSADVTLIAKYHVLATYSISFMNEGIEVDSLQQIVSEGSAGTAPVETMLSSCSEYVFEGWSTASISGTSATAPAYYDFATAVTGPVTLYAVYSFVDTSTGGSNDYTLVTNKADLTAGAKVIIGSGAYVMGPQAANNRPGLTTGATTWTKTGSTITLASGSTAAVLTVGIDGSNYTFAVDGGYLYAASSSSNYLRTQSTLDNNGKWALGAIDGLGKCASVVAQGSNTRETMALNGNLFACYDVQGSYGYMYFYKNTAAAEYTTNPICSPMIVVDQTDVEDSISTTDFVIGLGGTATSAGHTVFAKNCTSASYVQPVIFGVDKAVFSVNWTRVYLDNGAMDSVYTVSYSPVTGDSHNAFLYFETDDHLVISDTIPLYGEVCTAVVFGSQSATENTITINWTASSPDSELRVWNNLTVADPCESAPQPFDQTYILGTETTKTVTGLKASATYYYQATSGTCISEQRTITTSAASGVPALTASSSTIEFVHEVGKDTTQSVALSGSYMNNATVSVAIAGAGAAAFSTNASITLDGTGKGTLNVTYTPTSSQTFVAVATITYTSGCETKTVVVNLVGNVPGIDMVEVTDNASGFVIHTEFEGTPDIVLSQEVEHAGTGKVANDLFFSKYYEAYVSVKLLGIYNGTRNPISLDSVRIVQKKAGTWSSAASTEVIRLDTLGQLEPGKEIILYSSGTSGADTEIMNCVKDGIGFDHEGWYPVGTNTATKAGQPNLFGSTLVQFAGDKSIALQRQRADGSWAFLDLIGAGDSISSNNDSCIRVSTDNLNDDTGWYCPDGVNYQTKEPAPLSTNRHLLIRKNTVVDGLTAVVQDTADFVTLCAEWEGLNVPTQPDTLQAEIACEHFTYVAEFNYDGYYSSFERVGEDLVTFTPVGATAPGDWVGTFASPTVTFQDTLRCYNLQISVLRYYDMRTPATPVELTKAQVQGYQADALLGDLTAQAIIAALDTVEAASTQWRVPIIVKNSATVYTDDVNLFRDLSVDTCRTCDVVILNGGTLIKTTKTVNDRDSVRSVIVYNGGRLIVPDGLDYVVNDLQVRAKGDSVGAAYIEGNLNMKNPRIIHDKRIENDKYYFFTLPYDCPISKITQMNGKTMGPYGATWVIKYYDGAQRITNGGMVSNWKPLDAGATLKAGMGYVIGISSDVYKYVRFPMVANATFTEKNTAKTMDVTQYGQAQAYGTDGTDGTIGWNNVGWNLVGNPYVSYFTAQGTADSIMTGSTILSGRYLPAGGYGKDTWLLDDTENVYITVPDAVADGGYLQKRVSLTQLDPFISFFVQADRTGSLNFATSSREQVAKVMRAPVVDYNEVVLNFDVAGKSDRTTIILDKERNTSYEIGQDLLKWKGKWGKTPYLYSFDNANNPLAFNAINYDEAKGSVPVAFYMPTSYARYTFSIDRSASKLQNIEHVYLLRNGSVIADLLTTNYTATDLKLKSENKEFAISIQRAAEVVTPVNPTEDDALMPRAITERHEVRVEQLPAEGTVMVMDAVGRTIATRTLTGADNITFELPVDGVYTITVMTPARNYTLKTVIR